MPATKNQFLRQEIIHGLLSRFRLTKTEMLERINERLGEHDIKPIHWKTFNNDLTNLELLGASIHRPTRGNNVYYYQEQFIPAGSQFDEEEMDTLVRAVQMLKGIAGFRIAKDVEEILHKLKYTRFLVDTSTQHLISYEDHTLASGTEWLDKLSEALHLKWVINVCYQAFYRDEITYVFHPYYLKEYRNRWFVLGRNQSTNRMLILALDRIKSVKPVSETYLDNDIFVPEKYFKNLIGISNLEGKKPERIRFRVSRNTVPYLETKKLHHNQILIRKNRDGTAVFEIYVVINYELISTLLGFGEDIKILSPKQLVKDIRERIRRNFDQY